MPLSPPVDREDIHTRRIECRGYRRADGLWDIEGHITDVKAYAFDNADRGQIDPGVPLHDMWLRLTVDDAFQIRAVEAVTDASPYSVCGAITSNFQRLVGLTIGPGFTRRVKERLGGAEGCTHLVDLVGPVATTAFQTLNPILAREGRNAPLTSGSPARRPRIIDSCHAYASDGEIVRARWPEYYTGPGSKEGPAG